MHKFELYNLCGTLKGVILLKEEATYNFDYIPVESLPILTCSGYQYCIGMNLNTEKLVLQPV